MEGEKEVAEEETQEEEEEEVTRKRRNGLSTDEDQPQQSRLSNVFIPDDETVDVNEEEDEEDIWEGTDYEYEEEDDLFLSRDGADIDIGKLNLEERLKVRFSCLPSRCLVSSLDKSWIKAFRNNSMSFFISETSTEESRKASQEKSCSGRSRGSS